MIGIVVEDTVDVIGGKYKGLRGRVKKLTAKMVVVQLNNTGECVQVMKENVSKDLKRDDVGPKELLKRAIQLEFVAMQKQMDELILLMEKL
jgi:ribosomal protein L24